jgi:Rho GDP-dissociation inhibitor
MNSAGRPPVTIDLAIPGSEKTLKDKPFKIKEGAKFTMSAKFKVQHQILSGLHYVQIVKRKGIRVSKDQEMLVCSLLCANEFLDLYLDNLVGQLRSKYRD